MSKVHAAGFIAVSRRFHSLAPVPGDPYRANTGTTPSASSLACGGLTPQGPATGRLAGSDAVWLEAFGPVRVTAAVEDDAERVALELVEAVLTPDPSGERVPGELDARASAHYDTKAL